MSMIGTGVAAGVAQASLQAQQVARERDRKKTQEKDNARRVKETFESHLAEAENVEKIEPTDKLQIDDHLARNLEPNLPDLQAPPPVQADHDSGAESLQDTIPPTPPDTTQVLDHEGPLYHHLDVQG